MFMPLKGVEKYPTLLGALDERVSTLREHED
jgi:hypothetical protein